MPVRALGLINGLMGGLLASLLLLPVPSPADPAHRGAPDLLRLAAMADTVYDRTPTWTEEVGRLPQLPQLVKHITEYIEDEGYGSGRVPASVTMEADFGEWRSLVAGRYDTEADAVELNERYLTHPAWVDRPWLAVLVHELVHATGYPNEAQAQLITTEVLAAMANDGYPAALGQLADRIRRHALLSAWWLAAFEHDALPAVLSNSDRSTVCQMGCTQVNGPVAAVDAARRAVFDEGELRRELARERYWLERSRHDYDMVLGSYMAEPLGVMLAHACEEPTPLLLDRVAGPPPLFPSLDDTGAFLREIGWC